MDTARLSNLEERAVALRLELDLGALRQIRRKRRRRADHLFKQKFAKLLHSVSYLSESLCVLNEIRAAPTAPER